MELHDFIAITLGEIQEGVQSAINNTIAKGVKGAINPAWGITNDLGRQYLQDVQFDIAVTVVEKDTAAAKAGIKVMGLDVGGGGTMSAESSRVSRVKFSIPVIPPVTTINSDGE
jgi:hypothetical protein